MRHTRFLIVAIAVSGLNFGCVSNSTRSEATPSAASSERLSREFVQDFSSVSVQSTERSVCKFSDSKLSTMKWRERVQLAGDCVAAQQWARVEVLGTSLAAEQSDGPWGAYFLSLAAEGRGELDRSLWMTEQAIKRSPQTGLFHYQKGRALWRKGENSTAFESLLKSVQLDPNLIDSHLFLGQIFFRDQEFDKAARHFQAVLRARPRDPTATLGLAECMIQLGDAKRALELLKRGQGHHPENVHFLVREAVVHEALLNDIPRALEVLRAVQTGYLEGKFREELGFNVGQRITELEMSARSNRAVAGSEVQTQGVK